MSVWKVSGMLVVNQTEESEVALSLPIGPLKPILGWRRYRDTSTVPTKPMADDLFTVLSQRINFVILVALQSLPEADQNTWLKTTNVI